MEPLNAVIMAHEMDSNRETSVKPQYIVRNSNISHELGVCVSFSY